MSGLQGGDYIHRELGKQTALIETLVKSQEEFRKETKVHRAEASKVLTDLDKRIARVEEISMKNSSAIKNDVMPTVSEVKNWKQRGIGFLSIAGIAGTAFGVSIADGIRDFFFK